MIRDSCGRPVTNLRIAITQKCNLNCFYCHEEGEAYEGETEMTSEEIKKVVEIAASFGIKNVKLTGGEPLMRNDVVEIVNMINTVHGITDVSMTTNGTLLGGLAKPLKDAGLDRINITLDTLDPEIYRKITGINMLSEVVEGIREAKKVGLSPIKINMVVLNGVNEDQIWKLMQFANENGLILQLIELEDPNESEVYQKYHSDMSNIEEELEELADSIRVRSMQHRETYILADGGEVEVVKPMHNTEFCNNCTRIRITSDGKLKPCLFRSDNLIDFLTPMRNGASDETLRKIFVSAVMLRLPYFTN